MVSLNTNTPLRNAQPAMTAIDVSSRRPLRARAPFSAILNIESVAESLEPVEHAIGRRLHHLVDDLAVRQEDDAVGVARRAWIVRDHHDRLPELADGETHEVHDLRPGAA